MRNIEIGLILKENVAWFGFVFNSYFIYLHILQYNFSSHKHILQYNFKHNKIK